MLHQKSQDLTLPPLRKAIIPSQVVAQSAFLSGGAASLTSDRETVSTKMEKSAMWRPLMTDNDTHASAVGTSEKNNSHFSFTPGEAWVEYDDKGLMSQWGFDAGRGKLHETEGREKEDLNVDTHSAVSLPVVEIISRVLEGSKTCTGFTAVGNPFPEIFTEEVPLKVESTIEDADEMEGSFESTEEEAEEKEHFFLEEGERPASKVLNEKEDPKPTPSLLLAPGHVSPEESSVYCSCPVCLYQHYIAFFFSTQRRSSPRLLSVYPSYQFNTNNLLPLPPICDPCLGDHCPIYRAWGFCPHSVGCFLQHDAWFEAELQFFSGPSRKAIRESLPWRRPVVKRGNSAQQEIDRLQRKALLHLDSDTWSCDVCGTSSIGKHHVDQVGFVYTYFICPYCHLFCYFPEVTYLLEHILLEATDDYQKYKSSVDYYRTLLPDEFKVPFSYEAHELATTVFAWSLVSPKDLQYAINAAYRLLPSLSSVISIGSGVGYVEHLLNRVMNSADLPASGPVAAWKKLIAKELRQQECLAREICGCSFEDIEESSEISRATMNGHQHQYRNILKNEVNEEMEFLSSISEEKACFYGERVVPIFAFDELIRRYEYSVHVSVGGPFSVLSLDCENSVLLLCWPPFGSYAEEQSSMGYEALEYFHQRGGKVLIFIGDVSATGDWRFHEMRDKYFKLAREYSVRREVKRWIPQEMGQIYAGNDTIGVYERR